ncbi:MAG: alpha/beta hydrolase [Flavobacteriales bacterium]|nr:alpha/beta hydrolase [Flavobacteriales bacterium]
MKRTGMILAAVALAGSSAVALNPSKEYAVTPDEYGIEYEEVKLPTSDGLTLNGWWFKPATESTKCIIISDDGDGNMADNLELISQFITMEYHVLAYDYRGYGKSDEFEIKEKFFIYHQFSKDLEAAIGYVKKYHAKLYTVDLYGKGIGAGLSIGVGANNTKIKRVVADGTYVSFQKYKDRVREKEGKEVMLPIGYNKYIMEPEYALEEKGQHLRGILFIVGQNESITGPDDVKALAKLKKKESVVYEVEGATNKQTFTSNKSAYFDQVKDFLEKYTK